MKRLLSLMLVIAVAYSAKATHLMGGDMVVKSDTSGYTLTLSLYRDTSGIPLGANESVEMYVYDTATSNYMLAQTMFIPRNMALSTLLLPNFPYGVEVGIYTATLPLTQGKYKFVYATCCRNGAIGNATTPLNESMVLYTDLDVDSANNSTPGFLAMPVAYFPVNNPVTYNPLPYDPDMDSVSWALNTPIGNQTSIGSLAFTNVVGFTAPPADPAGPFAMNPVTGEITWTPDTVGNYIQSFEVKEYKNGVQVGTIIRDMQYVIVPGGSNVAPNFVNVTSYNTNTSQNYNYIYYTPGQQLVFQIQGTDVNSGNQLQMDAFSQAFQLNPAATFTVAGAGNLIAGNFHWTPPAGFTQDMIVVFRLRDGQFSKDFTLLMRKNPNPNAVNNINETVNNITVFPNPAQHKLNISLDLAKDINGDVALYSTIGQKVKSLYSGKIMKGTTQLSDDVNLAAGTYFMVVKDNGKAIKTVTVAIQ